MVRGFGEKLVEYLDIIGYSFSVTDGMMPFALHHFYNDNNKDNIYHIKGFGWYDLDKKIEL